MLAIPSPRDVWPWSRDQDRTERGTLLTRPQGGVLPLPSPALQMIRDLAVVQKHNSEATVVTTKDTKGPPVEGYGVGTGSESAPHRTFFLARHLFLNPGQSSPNFFPSKSYLKRAMLIWTWLGVRWVGRRGWEELREEH